MTFGRGEEVWLIVGVLLTAPPVVLFTLIYGALMPWYRSVIGRALFTNSLGLTMLVLAGTFRLFVGADNVIFQDLRLAIYTVLPVGAWFMLFAFARILWRNRAKAIEPGHVDMDMHADKQRLQGDSL